MLAGEQVSFWMFWRSFPVGRKLKISSVKRRANGEIRGHKTSLGEAG
jgi:hypothetical protein